MALQVWLPLNKDFSNKGIDNSVSVTTASVTIASGGKTGGYTQVTSSKRITIGAKPYMSPKSDNEFSIAMWVNATSFNYIIAFWAFELRITETAAFFRTGDGSSPYTVAAQYNSTFTTGTWYHICGTWSSKEGRVRLYINGSLVAENYNRPGSYKDSDSLMRLVYGGDWKLSDFRIYDNELTETDVKEIYWGKVLDITPPWKRGNVTELGDASGVNTEITPVNITSLGKELVFNGNAYATLKPLTISGGTLSVWFKMAKPGNAWLYVDGTSHMGLTFYNNAAYIIPWISSVSAKRFTAAAVNWGQWNHIAITYNYSDCTPDECFVNGVSVAQSGSDYWTNGDSNAYLGRRGQSGSNMTGSLGEVKVFTSKLTATEIQAIYNKGVMENDWELESPTWLRVLHHNNPKAARFASQEDGKNKDTEDQFSKLKIFFNNDNFRRADGNYEFMVKEKLESGSTEQVYRWSQTSNPTASTVTGYKLISQTNDPGRSFGLKHNGSYAVFHNGSTWWCACGSVSEFNGGIPGFGGTVLSGYLDLYVRVDKVTLPAGYTELQYVQSDGTAYINAIVNGFNTADWEIYCKWTVTGWGASYGYIFGAYSSENETSYRVILQNTDNDGYYVSSNCRAGSSIGVTNKAKNVIHTATLRDKSFDFDGVTYSAPTTGTAISTASTLCIFGRGSGTQNSKARVYELYGKKGGIPAFNLKPAKRDSDNAIGFYDLVNNRFVTKTGNGTLTGE